MSRLFAKCFIILRAFIGVSVIFSLVASMGCGPNGDSSENDVEEPNDNATENEVEDPNDNATENDGENQTPAPAIPTACERPDPESCTELDTIGFSVEGPIVLDDDCYRVQGVLESVGETITIAPGTTMYFQGGGGIRIYSEGELSAVGTPEEPICLTGLEKTRGSWRGIEFRNTPSEQNQLEHVVIEHAGGIVLEGEDAYVQISNSRLRNHDDSAIRAIDSSESTLTVETSIFEENEAPLRIEPEVAQGLSEDLIFENNDDQHVILQSDFRAYIDRDTKWKALDVPYYIRTRLTVRGESTLEIAPGSTLLFPKHGGLNVVSDSTLLAVGTDEASIHFRGREQERGHWRGLRFKDTASENNRLEYVIVEHGGSESWTTSFVPRNHGGIVAIGADTHLSISNALFRHNERSAIMAKDSPHTTVMVEDSIFEDNTRPIKQHIQQVENISPGNHIANNDMDVIALKPGSTGHHEVKESMIWPGLSVPYRVYTTIRVYEDVVVEPGAEFEFRSGQGLSVLGDHLTVAGSDSAPVVFRGTEPISGHWRGIHFANAPMGSKNMLSHVEVRHGGSDQWHNGRESSRGNVVLDHAGAACGGEATVSISNASISQGAGHGIAIRHGSRVTSCVDNAIGEVGGSPVFDHHAADADEDFTGSAGCYCEAGCECGD